MLEVIPIYVFYVSFVISIPYLIFVFLKTDFLTVFVPAFFIWAFTLSFSYFYIFN